ncbi:hypothetical protein CLUG_04320 [Clavispora lusitaniae ATCC 42720]|uniref:Uncharacterized protein n=1 Tax=Clavispora lusitaniae (strain ATCC 42720) TaxID=306902 RepID=C4Y7Z2_CLAL4|nr:uncharacterized protein CLUG_04320 [Clavispora lusitaniae ATCC 42720]EEQ40192.1 hypothetical protein CLUG_04320 [Clavispora lusitaniae ATCC 42720]
MSTVPSWEPTTTSKISGSRNIRLHHGVDNSLLVGDGAIVLVGVVHFLARFPEQAVGHRQDVGLVGHGDRRFRMERLGRRRFADRSSQQGNVIGDLGDPGRRGLGDSFDGLGHQSAVFACVALFFLDVQVLGVFTHNHHVHGSADAFDGLDGSDVGVQAQFLAQGHNWRRVTGHLHCGRRNGSEKSAVTLVSQHVHGLSGQRRSGLSEQLECPALQRVDKVKSQVELGGQVVSNTARPAGMTSRPIPSPGIKPIFNVFKAGADEEKARRA